MLHFIKCTVLVFVCLLKTHSIEAQVRINEVMTDNEDFLFDEDGDDADWIELYNPAINEICIEGWALSDDKDVIERWYFPKVCIPAKSYLFVWASGKSRRQLEDSLHTDFKLNAFGEDLFLLNDDGQVVDSLSLPLLNPNESYGKVAKSSSAVIFLNPTPGFANDTNSIKTLTTFSFESRSRVFNDQLRVGISKVGDCTEFFMNDRGIPYAGEMLDLGSDTNYVILNPGQQAPYFSFIPTTKDYRIPKTVNKLPHLTVSCLDQDIELGTLSKTYFPQGFLNVHELPMVNLDLEALELFDSRSGILVEGEEGNFRLEGRKWERSGEACLYMNDTLLCQDFGVRVHGHASRELPQKSLKLYNRNTVDSSSYDRNLLFDESGMLSRFVLRSFHSDHIGNEFTDFGFRDDVIMSIVRPKNVVYAQSSRPVVGYIKGEYWGLFSLHDASDNDFISSKTGLHPDSIDLFSGPEALLQESNSVVGLDLDLVSERAIFERYFDLENLVDYLLYQLFFLNTDWPHNNVKFWKEKGRQGPYFFVLFDMDATMKSVKENYFARFYSGQGLSARLDPAYNRFWQQLFASSYFIDLMKLRYAELRRDLLSTDVMLDKIEIWKEAIDSEIDNHIERWHYPRSKKAWLKSYQEVQEFVAFRDLYFSRQLNELTTAILYPNPTQGDNIFIREAFVETYESARIHTLSGRLLAILPIQNGVIDLSTLNLNSQCLIFDLVAEDHVRTEKVIWRR